jgi:hypothetical protein
MAFSTTSPALDSFWWLVGGSEAGSGPGEPLDDGGGHDVDGAAVLLIQGGVEVYPPFP